MFHEADDDEGKKREKILFVINFNLNCFHATINRERDFLNSLDL